MIRILCSQVLWASALVAAAGTAATLPAQVMRTSAPALTSLTPSNTNPDAGGSLSIVLTFSRPVVEDSVVIQLLSSHSVITLPSTVILRPSDGSQLSVKARVGNTRSDEWVTLSATVAGHSTDLVVIVRALRRVASLTFANDTVLRGGATIATVTLNEPTFSEASVALSHSGGLSIPAMLTIPPLSPTATFTVSPQLPGPKTVSASLNGSTVSGSLTVLDAGVIAIGLELPYSSASPGVTMNGTLQAKALELAPGGATIALSASPAGILTIPATVTVTQPNSWLPFPITVGQVPSQTTVTITASSNAVTRTVQLIVSP